MTAFDEYVSRLESLVRSDDRIIGLVLLGSGVDPARIDEWSDHDVALVVTPEAVDTFRDSVVWLPDAADLAARGREWHDGFKGMFDDGRVIEYAVTDLGALSTFPMAAASVVFDRGGVADAVATAIASTVTRTISSPDGLAAALLVEILVGVGRLRRGERLSGGDVIRSEAALTFIDLWMAVCHAGAQHPDPFNGWRRIESVDPFVARRLSDALAQDAEVAAHDLLALAEEVVGQNWSGWPARGVEAVRRRLAWDGA